MTRHAWLDVTAGVAGDMLLGATLDAGASIEAVQQVVDALVPGSVRLRTERVVRGGQAGTKARVQVLVDDPPHRTWASIRQQLTDPPIPEQTRAWALAAFGLLADAEAAVHGTSPDEVHFHEVGALDSIADVVGACEGLRLLGVTSVSASALSLGDGRVRAAHGDIPVPVPAVARLVLGWPVLQTRFSGARAGQPDGGHDHPHPHGGHAHESHVHGSHGHGDHGHHHDAPHDTPAPVTVPGAVGELATPTGVALVRALAGRCEPLPSMTPVALGVGCGGKDFADHANVVRLVVGDLSAAPKAADDGGDPEGVELEELMANVDDLDPRLWPGVLDALLAAGARDAWLAPITMKKGRPAFTVHALVTAAASRAVGDVLLTRTSTLGYRSTPVRRTMLERSFTQVEVAGEQVVVKVGHRDGRIVHAAVEFDSLAAAARRLGLGEQDLLHRATVAMGTAGLMPGAIAPAD